MATNADFNALINRIDAATETLEQAVSELEDGATSVSEDVLAVQQLVVEANQAVAAAQQAANSASQDSQEALQAVSDATLLVDQLEAAVVLVEAPTDGQTYGRRNSNWVVVDIGEATQGTVTGINGVQPDTEGEVTLTPEDIGALPDTYTPPEPEAVTWDDVEDKPTTFPPSSHTHTTDAITSGVFNTARLGTGEADETTILYGDGTWREAPEGGGGEAQPYPVSTSVDYNGAEWTEWPTLNPNTPASVGQLGGYVMGDWVGGSALFASLSRVNSLPDGDYAFVSSDWTSGPLAGEEGVISVRTVNSSRKLVVATVNPPSGGDASIYIREAVNTENWLPVSSGGGGGGAAGGHPVEDRGLDYQGSTFTEWPYDNPNQAVWIGDLGGYVRGSWAEGGAIFARESGVEMIPDGTYYFRLQDFTSGPLNMKIGTITVNRIQWGSASQYYTQVVATAMPVSSVSSDFTMYALEGGEDGNWVQISGA